MRFSNTNVKKKDREKKKKGKKDKVLDEINDKIFEIPDPPSKFELGDGLANVSGPEAEDILKEEFVNLKKT